MHRFPALALLATLAGCAGNFDPGPTSPLGVLAPGGVCGVYPPGSAAWQTCMAVGPSGPAPGQSAPGFPSQAGFPLDPMASPSFSPPGMPQMPGPLMPSIVDCKTISSRTVDPNADSSTTTTDGSCHG